MLFDQIMGSTAVPEFEYFQCKLVCLSSGESFSETQGMMDIWVYYVQNSKTGFSAKQNSAHHLSVSISPSSFRLNLGDRS